METLTLHISGMTCDGCVANVVRALEGVEGVAMADVSLEQGTARVTFDGRSTNPADLISAVEDAGFDVSP
ncbi:MULTISPECIES: heavy-metal-associated domain-containing protein [Komagataeibacter]|uniref:Mercuric transport protein periplasmic component n=1 Tax=Komagataeibacter saccharivorans TaxID=265959 RepID=A0A347WCV6_9PROT|nr:heavy-metal-associated domain-containing protein [Komagataeibacter saccharivorans]AXY22699.1 Mercuric transport protein periplasmic component precursor [Komagataeibacter saccharivorans]PMP98475.1 Copper-transporting ATPase [Komagataeibacter saccharivorans]PYD51981.1 metal-binding protein [Komagataeibacter saccharivorans]QBL93406.1 hypothetical protein KSAC_11740 [Komagataeibacter saccharivorans]GBQ39196.1 cation/copper resistance transporter ATPase CopZ [Komagataeibacter saccharivorans NRIC